MSTKFRKHSLAIVIFAVTLAAANAFAATNPGDLDLTFSGDGKLKTPLGGHATRALALSGGKILVVGGTTVPDPVAPGETISAAMLIRYNSDGSQDSSLGGAGIVRSVAFENVEYDLFPYDWSGEAVLVADNKIIVAGRAPRLQGAYSEGSGGFIVARYHMNGVLDSSFARRQDLDPMQPGGPTDTRYEFSAVRSFGMLGLIDEVCGEQVTALARQTNGQLLIIFSSQCGFSSSGAVIRVNANGTPDLTYGIHGLAQIGAGAVALHNDQLLVAGRSGLFRVNSAGRHDTTFTAASLGDLEPSAVMVQSSGKIVVTGSTATGIALTRLNVDGSLDTSFGNGGFTISDFASNFGAGTGAIGRTATLQPEGKIVIAGEVYFPTPPFLQMVAVARYTADGDLDTSFGSGGVILTTFTEYVNNTNTTPHAVAVDEVGRIVVAGMTANNVTDADLDRFVVLARFHGDNNTQPGINTVTVGPATLTFSSVSAAGATTVTTSASGPPPPVGFALGDPPTFYEIETTATVVPPIRVCLDYTGVTFVDEFQLRLTHLESGVWVDRTLSLFPDTNIICANVMSLSPFAIFEEAAPSDTTPPLIAPSAMPSANGSGWNNSNVSVSWSVIDSESGIATSTGCESVTLTSETAGTTIHCTATNGAGLTTANSITIRIDKTPPLVTASAPQNGAEYLLNQTLNTSYSCADVLSGLVSCVGLLPSGASLPTGVVGAASFAIEATDIAGNTAAVSIGYAVRYGFAGFFSPLENLPAINVVNAGRTIPTKWRLTDARGVLITEISSFVSLSSVPIACDASSTTALGEVASGTAQYDADASHFKFNWKTDSGWTGCRMLQVSLSDGSTHVAKLQMK